MQSDVNSAERDYAYYAFVSYSHKDAKWAEWIQRAIEHYKLPAVIRKEAQKPLPKRIAPVFRDATDLGVDVLVDGLHAELENSRYLIVVCSPNSAKPNAEGKHFVDDEVRHFCELGRVKQIIPVIIEGNPEESFSPELKSKEILALDATKQSKARILNDIVAKILGLKPDVLWRREKKRIREKRIAYGIFAAVLSFVVLGLTWMFNDRYCEHVEYYADYINDWGVPSGIMPLSKQELAHRSRYYKFTYRGYASQSGGASKRVLRTVCFCDASGLLADDVPHVWINRPPRQDFYYEGGKLIRKVASNADGMEMYSLTISDDGVWSKSIKSLGDSDWFWGGTIAGYEDMLKNFLGLNMSVARFFPELRALATIPSFFVSEENAAGMPTRIDFLPNNQSRISMPNGLGAYGERYSYDEVGRLVGVRFLEKDGNLFAATNVFAGLDVSYNGLTTTVVSVDVKGKPIANTFGWITMQFVYTSSGNLKMIQYLDENMNLMPGPIGVAILKKEYDEEGNHEICVSRYDSNEELVTENVGWAICEIKWHGNVRHEYYKKATGAEYITEDGYSHISIERTPSQRIERYYINGDVPTRHAKSFAHKSVCEQQQTTVEGECLWISSWYDEQQQPCLSRNPSFGNVSNVTMRIGLMGVEEIKFLPEHEAICASVKCDRSLRFGKPIKSRIYYLDADGKLVVPRKVELFDIAQIEKERLLDKLPDTLQGQSDNTDCLEVSFDMLGRIDSIIKLRNTLSADVTGGCAQTKIYYGDNGLISRIMLLDKEGVATTNNALGIAAVDFGYDRKGLTDIVFLNQDMKPATAKVIGISRMSVEYDRYGHLTWTRLYDEKNKLTVSPLFGGAVIHQEHSPQGHPLLQEHFGSDFQRIGKRGAYSVRFLYEKQDDRIVYCERYFDKDGETPIVPSGIGYHMLKNVLNFRRQIIEQATYDLDCKTLMSNVDGVARMVVRYNGMGQPEGMRRYDSKNKLIVEIVDENGDAHVPLRVFSNTRGRWGLQDNDVIVAVDGVFCLGDEELTKEKMAPQNTFKKVKVARFNSLWQSFEIKDVSIPVDDDNEPASIDLRLVPLGVFSTIRTLALLPTDGSVPGDADPVLSLPFSDK